MSDMADVPTQLEPIPEPPAKRRSPLPMVLAIVALLVVIGGVMVIASDGDGGEDAIDLLSNAPDAARDAGTARMQMTATVGGGGFDMEMDGEGAVDFTTGAQTFEMRMFGVSFEMRIIDQVMYMRLPDLGRPPGMDTAWVGLPIETADGAANPMAQLQSGTGMIDALRGMGNEVEELGTEEINGVEATGYRVTIDMAKAIEQLPEDEREAGRASLDQMAAMGMESWPMDVWVNDDGLPVRMAMDIDMGTGTDPAIPDDLAMTMQIDYVDFGADVVIEAPPAADTTMLSGMTELNELMGTGGAGAVGDLELSSD